MDSTCELLKTCSFFSIELTSKTLTIQFQKKYCNENKELCARYMIAAEAGLNKIPTRLYPNEYDKALDIIYG